MKKYLFGIFAIALAIGFSAFTAPAKTSKGDAEDWYFVHVSGSTLSEANYDAFVEQQPMCGDEEVKACQIQRLDINTDVTGARANLATYLSQFGTEAALVSDADVISTKE